MSMPEIYDILSDARSDAIKLKILERALSEAMIELSKPQRENVVDEARFVATTSAEKKEAAA